MNEEMQTKLLGFLVNECGRTETAQMISARLCFAPSGFAEETLGTWERRDDPERFLEYARQEQWAQEILQIAGDHVNTMMKGRYRYVVRTIQLGGQRVQHNFTLEPAYVTGTALEMSDRSDGPSIIARGLETALRINAQMHEGSVRTLLAQNKMLAEENTQLRDQNFKLIHEIEETRSNRMERQYHLRTLERKEALKEQGSQKLFQVLDVVMSEIQARRGGKAPPPPQGDGMFEALVRHIVIFGQRLRPDQVGTIAEVLDEEQLEIFRTILKIAGDAAATMHADQQKQQQDRAPNGANGNGAPPNGAAHA